MWLPCTRFPKNIRSVEICQSIPSVLQVQDERKTPRTNELVKSNLIKSSCLAQRASGVKLQQGKTSASSAHPCHFFTRHANLLTNQNATFLGKLPFYSCFSPLINRTTMIIQSRPRKIDRSVFQVSMPLSMLNSKQ